MLVIIDNYDSFIYNLYQYFSEFADEVKVFRNDAASVAQIRALQPQGIIISPGPGRPEDAGIAVEIIRALYREIPIFGVCLGHQAIGYAFGGKINNAQDIVHGKADDITHFNDPLFAGVESPFRAGRYHSLIVSRAGLPDNLEVIAVNSKDEIMALKIKGTDSYGVQFHPESILTPPGKQILKNWYSMISGKE